MTVVELRCLLEKCDDTDEVYFFFQDFPISFEKFTVNSYIGFSDTVEIYFEPVDEQIPEMRNDV